MPNDLSLAEAVEILRNAFAPLECVVADLGAGPGLKAKVFDLEGNVVDTPVIGEAAACDSEHLCAHVSMARAKLQAEGHALAPWTLSAAIPIETQGRGTKIGGCYVVSAALKTTGNMFAPVFVIHEGDNTFGTVLYKQEYPAPGPLNLATMEEAFDAADAMAANWIAQNRPDLRLMQ